MLVLCKWRKCPMVCCPIRAASIQFSLRDLLPSQLKSFERYEIVIALFVVHNTLHCVPMSSLLRKWWRSLHGPLPYTFHALLLLSSKMTVVLVSSLQLLLAIAIFVVMNIGPFPACFLLAYRPAQIVDEGSKKSGSA